MPPSVENRPIAPTKVLVFTDLDGTLLDHDSYDWRPAAGALSLLRSLGIPVIPVTSKTRAELAVVCDALGLVGPRVAENGTVITLGSSVKILGPGYDRIVSDLEAARNHFSWRFVSFSDMDASSVAAATGLTLEESARAMLREATVPIIWQDTDDNLHRFRAYLIDQGLKILRGGRFLHILADGNKGQALRTVAQAINPRAKTIALGDSPNDRDLLLAADIPVIVKRKHAGHLALPERPDAKRTEQPGPAGWNQAILELLGERP